MVSVKRIPVSVRPANLSIEPEALHGDVRSVLSPMRENSIHCAVTSPPYWGLRDYHSDPQVWDGDPACQHEWGNRPISDGQNAGAGQFCVKCGAWSGQLGLEPTPELYTSHLVQICREVRRVLREDGTLWLNLGDSYYGGKGASNFAFQTRRTSKTQQKEYHNIMSGMGQMRPDAPHPTLKPKDLVGIPWRVAFALQQDGWWLRNAVCWVKPNPMPASVSDRLTCSYEHVFLLTKSASYFYDAEAVKEEAVTGSWDAMPPIGGVRQVGKNGNVTYSGNTPAGDGRRNRRDVWTIPTKSGQWEFCFGCQSLYEGRDRSKIIKKGDLKFCPSCGSHDKWVDHFAMFPEKLVEPCILAGTSAAGCCPECGAPWKRIVESVAGRSKECPKTQLAHEERGGESGSGRIDGYTTTLGWRPTCACPSAMNPIPCSVLDLFSGSGTTGVVAAKHGRRYVGIDVKPEYAALSLARVKAVPPVRLWVDEGLPRPDVLGGKVVR